MVLGEGAALLVLEPWERAKARGATIHGEVLGYGLSTDHGHITKPSVDGQATAMRRALQSAGLSPSQVDAINAHGTGTQANDAVETAAIKAIFAARAHDIPISATKALHGHLLGATAALEGALSLLAMQQGIALPTITCWNQTPNATSTMSQTMFARVSGPGRCCQIPSRSAVRTQSWYSVLVTSVGGSTAVRVRCS